MRGGAGRLEAMAKLILIGDIDPMNVIGPTVAFLHMRDELGAPDMVFSDLECFVNTPPAIRSFHNAGLYADPATRDAALRDTAIGAMGIANNVNYGEAAFLASIGCSDAAGTPQTGAGPTKPCRAHWRISRRGPMHMERNSPSPAMPPARA